MVWDWNITDGMVMDWKIGPGLAMDQQNGPRFASDWEIGAVFEWCVEWQTLCVKSSSVETNSRSIQLACS